MKHYANYILEREGFQTIQHEYGFATYRCQGNEVYLRDIYVDPDYRKSRVAAQMTDQVAQAGRAAGCTVMTGTCQPSAKGATEGLKAMLAYGFQIKIAAPDMIVVVIDL